MFIERRELYVSFWDESLEAGVYALLIGWIGDDPSTMIPVVAHGFGIEKLEGKQWKVSSTVVQAKRKARSWEEDL